MYEEYKTYGPYICKDGRLRITLVKGNIRTSVSYPKFLMEHYLGRYLISDETVDHVDKNPLNNDLSNLQVLIRSEHSKLDARRFSDQMFECPVCGILFNIAGLNLNNAIQNRRKGKAGPFCTRSCAGKYSKNIQIGMIEPLDVKQIVPEYHNNKEIPV